MMAFLQHTHNNMDGINMFVKKIKSKAWLICLLSASAFASIPALAACNHEYRVLDVETSTKTAIIDNDLGTTYGMYLTLFTRLENTDGESYVMELIPSSPIGKVPDTDEIMSTRNQVVMQMSALLTTAMLSGKKVVPAVYGGCDTSVFQSIRLTNN